MKKHYRIKTKQELDLVFKQRKAHKNEYFSILYRIDKEQPHFRYAISIGRKYGSAVSRNLIKRQLRMLILENKDNFFSSLQFVVVVYPKAQSLDYQEIKKQIYSLFKKITE
jgi:ribonuclease P protein component